MAAHASTYGREAEEVAGRVWWLFLVTGAAWLLLAILIFRFDWTTVASISLLFGFVVLSAGVIEVLSAFTTHGWRRLGHALLAVAFLVIGIVAFIHPGDTFAALAAVMSFYLLFKGTFDVAVAIGLRQELDLWWLHLMIGIAEILLAFWAAGYFGRSVVLLVVWVGASCLARGVTEIMMAFALRRAAHEAAES